MTYVSYTEHMDAEQRAEFDLMLLGEETEPAPPPKPKSTGTAELASMMRQANR